MRAFLAFVVVLLVLAEAKTNTSAPSIVPVTTTPAPTTETPVPTTTAAPTTTPVPTTTAPPSTTTPASTTTAPPTTTPTPPPTTLTPEPTTEEPTPAPTTRGTTRPAPTTAVAAASDDSDTMTYALIGGGCGLVMVLAIGISYTLAKSRQRVSDYAFDKRLSPLDTFRSGHNVVTLSGRLTAQYDMTPFGNPAFDVVEPPPPPPMYSMQHYEYPSAAQEASFSADSGYSHIPSFQTDSDIFDSHYSLHSATSDVAYSTDSFSDTSSDYGGRYSQSCEI
ncbi:hypothetical protein SPRG_07435 [Saprolegnia parasitica CBS 223.65]|uniref:Uncharacterized protein n=1 Tax=Saprolegnia parasitica (strain CBS 223.65) TaxID=695850 RepID=A0A067CKY0_SAPPC|nr:hypothetical protein SPRG_07435 [Saprolegnia parasitica CBS 223.65]KDO27186.1 hypothetical protein SPRG_07435 [Saprolegnia parasitica CBS 223.65]|eukprot:XP_012201964.1 hypothetical protein SPRG_07435 [Saprolegnia parasitica CBS 223.65]